MKYAIACLYNTTFDLCIQKLIDDMKNTNVDIYILTNTQCNIKNAKIVQFSEKDIADKYVIDFIKPKSHWDYFTIWASSKQCYDYIWLIEDCVHYGGDWKNFFKKYNVSDAELITQSVNCAKSEWCWWKKPRTLFGKESGYPNSQLLKKYRTSLLPCSRYSKELLRRGIDSLNNNKKAFREIFWPTLAKNVKNIDNCDIGVFSTKRGINLNHTDKLNYGIVPRKKTNIREFPRNLDIVISCYKTSFSWILDISHRFQTIYLYFKDNIYDENVIRLLRTKGHIVIIQQLKNVGRCDQTYLYHIVNYYNQIKNFTIFTKDTIYVLTNRSQYVCRHQSSYDKLVYFLKNQKESFTWFPVTNNCEYSFKLKQYQSDLYTAEYHKLDENLGEWAKEFGINLPSKFISQYRGTFGSNGEKIRKNSRLFYCKLLENLSIYNHCEQSHFMERIWMFILS